MNTFGTKLRITTFGESHGPAIGGIIDGFPSNFQIDFEALQTEIDKRTPGSSKLVTQRKEKDVPEFLSGISENGITYGTPIGFIIRNYDNRSQDYSESAHKYRPNHADFTYDDKYGIRDYRGGGRASARETANWVVAGALAQQWLKKEWNVNVDVVLSAVGKISYLSEIKSALIQNPFTRNILVIPFEIKGKMEDEILKAKNNGDSIGGMVTCLINGMAPGYGDPVFNKLHAKLAQAMMSINAAKGFEYGIGFQAAESLGSDTLDIFTMSNDKVSTATNFSGGIQGGISNGMPIFFNVAFKPTPTIMRNIPTLTDSHEQTILKMRGRHDPCVAVRAVPVVKAMAALVVADFLL